MKLIARLLFFVGLLLSPMLPVHAGWFGDKYSMFIHYGLYSIPGGVFEGKPVTRGYSEQILTFGIGFSDWYEAYAHEFTAEHFDPQAIVELARSAGMRSIVLTSKHHDGFCLWNTATTDYNTYAGTPARRDLVAELAEACHASGMHFGLYFSLIDWHYPAAMPFSSHNADPVTPEHHQYNMSQVRELLTKYGKVDELWFDMASLTPQQSREMYALVKELQPECMVSGRLGNDQADFCVMPDNQYPDYLMDMPWQSAASMFEETWGYRSWQKRGSAEDKAVEKLTSLIDVVSSGGKYLLNIGPMGDGAVVPFEADVLRRIGAYIEPMKEAIYETLPAPFPMSSDRPRMTMSEDGRELYVFVPRGTREVVVPPTIRSYSSVRMLDGSRVSATRRSDGSTVIRGVSGDAPFNVVHLHFLRPLKADLSVLKGRMRPEPFFAQSSGDYYSTFKSIVGYRYVSDWKARGVHLTFGDPEKGRTILINDREVRLEPDSSAVVSVPALAVGSGMQEAEAHGLMGTLRPSSAYQWRESKGAWTEVHEHYVGAKSGVVYRQIVNAPIAGDYPVEVEYTEGMLIFVNGAYLDGTPAVREGGKLIMMLPLDAGENELMIKLYARWGTNCRMKLTPLRSYTRYTMEIPDQLLSEERGRYKVMDIKRPHVASQASPAHLSGLRLRVER